MCKMLSVHNVTRHMLYEITIIHYSKIIKLYPKHRKNLWKTEPQLRLRILFCISSPLYTKFISLRKFWYCLFSRSNTEVLFATLVPAPLFKR